MPRSGSFAAKISERQRSEILAISEPPLPVDVLLINVSVGLASAFVTTREASLQ